MVTQQRLTDYGASELATMIARGDVSSVEVVDAHIARIEAVNPALNAVVVKRYEEARAEAQMADQARQRGEMIGPLHGVPITIKECLDVQGMPTTFGLLSRRSHRAAADDPYVSALRHAGAIVLGKTNIPQLLLYYESHNPVYGRTHNPWNTQRASGGSSGGEAAIIAARGSPLGLGNDIGGSLRVPAHFCGIVSLKPTVPRILDFTRMADQPRYGPITTVSGPLARTVDDLAVALQLMNDVPHPLASSPQPLADFRAVDLTNIRVGYYVDDGTFTPSPAIKRAVREAVDVLRSQGVKVRLWTPPDVPYAVDLFYRYMTSDGGQLLRGLLGQERAEPQIGTLLFLTKQPRRRLQAMERALRLAGQRSMANSLRSIGYLAAQHLTAIETEIKAYRQRVINALDQSEDGPIDAIICPPCGLPAYTHGASQQLGVSGGYAPLYNLLGYPAGAVPITRVRSDEEIGRIASFDLVERAARTVESGSAGLPVGVQVVARPWHEHVVLAIMQTLQQAVRSRPDYPQLPIA
jgi:fatty acid amide hydrolase